MMATLAFNELLLMLSQLIYAILVNNFIQGSSPNFASDIKQYKRINKLLFPLKSSENQFFWLKSVFLMIWRGTEVNSLKFA